MHEQGAMIDVAMIEKCAQDPDLALSHLRSLFETLVSEDETLREWTSEAFENCGPPSDDDFDWIVDMLRSREGDQSFWAATFLGRLEERARKATSKLIETILNVNQGEATRQRAAWALHRIGGLSEADKDHLKLAMTREESAAVRKMIALTLNETVP